MTREEYQDRQDRKMDRLRVKAAGAQARSRQSYKTAKSMASVIPFGQPILVGHHSEGRDRRYRAKIESKFRQAFEASKAADYWQDRIAAAEANTSISSDDPDAVEKLQAKIAQLEETLELYKAINKIARSRKSLEAYPEADRVADIMENFGFSQKVADNLVENDRLHGRGIPSFSISNMRQNCTRYKKRLEEMQWRAQQTDQEKEYETTEGTVKIFYNTDQNRVQILFPGKPSEATRNLLKRSWGFRWSNRFEAWQRHLNGNGKYAAKSVVKAIMVNPDDMDMTHYNL